MSLFRASVATFLVLAPLAPCSADPAPVIHNAQGENLENLLISTLYSFRELVFVDMKITLK